METIIDLYGCTCRSGDYFYHENRWYGYALLKDDHSFEGVAGNRSTGELYFIFGRINQKNISLARCPIDHDQKKIQRMIGKGYNQKYYGTHYENDFISEVPIGEFQLSVMNAELTREESEEEKAQLRKQISFMSSLIEGKARVFYEFFMDVDGNYNYKNNKSISSK